MGKFFWGLFYLLSFPFRLIFWVLKIIYKKLKNLFLRKSLSKISVDKVDCLNGYEFEELISIIFSSLNYKVIKTKKSRDFGADLLVEKSDYKIAIQTKLYFSHNVGTSAIQEIATAKQYYNYNISLVVTNSYFTKPAKALADKLGVLLVDRNNLQKLLGSHQNEQKLLLTEILKSYNSDKYGFYYK